MNAPKLLSKPEKSPKSRKWTFYSYQHSFPLTRHLSLRDKFTSPKHFLTTFYSILHPSRPNEGNDILRPCVFFQITVVDSTRLRPLIEVLSDSKLTCIPTDHLDS